jgi:hypothetical protein
MCELSKRVSNRLTIRSRGSARTTPSTLLLSRLHLSKSPRPYGREHVPACTGSANVSDQDFGAIHIGIRTGRSHLGDGPVMFKGARSAMPHETEEAGAPLGAPIRSPASGDRSGEEPLLHPTTHHRKRKYVVGAKGNGPHKKLKAAPGFLRHGLPRPLSGTPSFYIRS